MEQPAISSTRIGMARLQQKNHNLHVYIYEQNIIVNITFEQKKIEPLHQASPSKSPTKMNHNTK